MSVDKHLAKIATNAAVSAAIFNYTHPSGVVISTAVGDLKPWHMGLALGAASSFAATALHNWILPHISENQKFRSAESALIHVGGAGASFVAGEYVLQPALARDEMNKVFVTGAMSELVAGWFYHGFVEPAISGSDYKSDDLNY